MTSTDDFHEWINQLAAGNEAAAQAVWQEYFGKLQGLARRKLVGLPLRIADEEDVALSALKSFVNGVEQGRFPRLNDRDDLWRLLITITARKAMALRKRQTAAKRGGGKIRGESALLGNDQDKHGGIGEVLGSTPTPEIQAMMTEQCEQMLAKLDDETLQRVALLKLEGYSNQEIAEAMCRSTRQVERWLSRIRAQWASSHD